MNLDPTKCLNDYYLKIFHNYSKLSLSGIDRICYDQVTYSIEGNI